MKRNRLLKSQRKDPLFTSAKPHNKHRHFYIISSLSVLGVLLGSVVLATNASVKTDVMSQIIPLPNQDRISTDGSQQLALADTTPSLQLELNTPTTIRIPESKYKPAPQKHAVTTEPEILENILTPALSESEALERYYLNKKDSHPLKTTAEPATVATTEDSATQANEDSDLNWQTFTIESGDNLSLLFPKAGLSARDVYNVAQTKEGIAPLLSLQPGQSLRIGTNKDADGNTVLQQLQLQLNPTETLTLTVNDSGDYVADTVSRDVDHQQNVVAGQIRSSLFEAGYSAGMSNKVIMELAHIFGWDIDFALDLRRGDNFKVIYEEDYLDGKKIGDGNILAAEFTNRGETYRAIRYVDADGDAHFYTPEGKGMRKTFIRTPVEFSRISSKFNPNRKHPILKTNRPHNGVDYAAPIGTPVLATGDGTVEFVGSKNGYGHTVVLSHGNTYSTLYAHLSKFKSGLATGQRVKQGDVIAYVGMSGLATGPHLHYEFRINGVHKNPLTVALPNAPALDKKLLADFQQQAQPLLAKLDATELPVLALNKE